jgi:hypothetical protein
MQNDGLHAKYMFYGRQVTNLYLFENERYFYSIPRLRTGLYIAID